MLRTTLLAATLATGLAAATAQAAEIYDWTASETNQFSGVSIGTLTGTMTVDAGTVTAITGSSTTLGAISALLAPGVFGDNQFPLTQSGVGFQIGGTSLNMYATFFFTRIVSRDGGVRSDINFTATLQPPLAVPEPMSLALFGLGLAGLAVVRRARD